MTGALGWRGLGEVPDQDSHGLIEPNGRGALLMGVQSRAAVSGAASGEVAMACGGQHDTAERVP